MRNTKIITFYLFLSLSCVNQARLDSSFIIATYDDVKDWDPATAFSLEVLPMSNIYEPLLWYDASTDSGQFFPGLAVSYSKSSDGLTWEFILREGVSFHDGSSFDSETVKFVVNRNKTMNGGASYIWSAVDSVLTDGPQKVRFKLSFPAPLDKIVSSQYGAWMYSPNMVNLSQEEKNHGYAIGTGPYRFKEWIKNKHIVLEKNINYWRKWEKSNHFESVNIKVVSEASTRLQMIESGMVDYALLVPVQLLERLESNPSVTVSYRPSWINHFYLLNTKKHPTDNIWVRRAIAASMNREAIAKYVYRDSGSEAAGIIPKNMPMFSRPDSLIPFNLEAASNFLVRSGFKNKQDRLDISYVSTSEEYRLTSFHLMDNLRKIGIGLDLKPGIWSMNWDKARQIKTSPNIISMAWWPTLSSPSDWFFGLYHTEEFPLFNLSYYSNSVVDSLINEGWKNEAINPEISKKIYTQIQNILIGDCVVVPTVDINVQSVYRSDISGFKDNPAYSTLLVYHLGRIND
tara:strand:+ start:683 stop:2227 length:1545 start_codon:yes stop_codon:yes gene_type:complete